LSFQRSSKGKFRGSLGGGASVECSDDLKKWKFNFQMKPEVEVATDFTAKHGIGSKTDCDLKRVGGEDGDAVESECDVD
jgi:hypothetical protein